jgi:hypothetical protein
LAALLIKSELSEQECSSIRADKYVVPKNDFPDCARVAFT